MNTNAFHKFSTKYGLDSKIVASFCESFATHVDLPKEKWFDTSPMYLQFLIVPCYYIICFGCLMGFNMFFYIIFGTNLLTGGPVPVFVFAYFSVSQKRNIKRNPNGTKPSRGSFLEQTQSRRLGVEVRDATRRP